MMEGALRKRESVIESCKNIELLPQKIRERLGSGGCKSNCRLKKCR